MLGFFIKNGAYKAMNTRITASGATTIAFAPRKLRINVNGSLTGTITVTDDVPATPELAANTQTRAVITNPVVGDTFLFGQFRGTVKVNPSATCDITITSE